MYLFYIYIKKKNLHSIVFQIHVNFPVTVEINGNNSSFNVKCCYLVISLHNEYYAS